MLVPVMLALGAVSAAPLPAPPQLSPGPPIENRSPHVGVIQGALEALRQKMRAPGPG